MPVHTAAPMTEEHRQERMRVLEAYLIVLRDVHRFVDLLCASKDTEEQVLHLQRVFGLDERQCHAVLEMRFRRLQQEEQEKLEQELKELRSMSANS